MQTGKPPKGSGNGYLMVPDGAIERIYAAVGILQSIMLARDSATDGNAVWGSHYMPDSALEHAINLLVETLPDVEE